jgi:chromosome segregation ATPase
MNEQTTPRTNDQSVRYYDDATGTRIEYVASRFARQLERELTQRERQLAEARNEITGWRNKWDCAVDMAARAENALDELAERLDFQEKLNRESIDQIAARTKERDEMTLLWERTNDALFAERALADRLGEALKDITGVGAEEWGANRPCVRHCNEALTAWKEARK